MWQFTSSIRKESATRTEIQLLWWCEKTRSFSRFSFSIIIIIIIIIVVFVLTESTGAVRRKCALTKKQQKKREREKEKKTCCNEPHRTNSWLECRPNRVHLFFSLVFSSSPVSLSSLFLDVSANYPFGAVCSAVFSFHLSLSLSLASSFYLLTHIPHSVVSLVYERQRKGLVRRRKTSPQTLSLFLSFFELTDRKADIALHAFSFFVRFSLCRPVDCFALLTFCKHWKREATDHVEHRSSTKRTSPDVTGKWRSCPRKSGASNGRSCRNDEPGRCPKVSVRPHACALVRWAPSVCVRMGKVSAQSDDADDWSSLRRDVCCSFSPINTLMVIFPFSFTFQACLLVRKFNIRCA